MARKSSILHLTRSAGKYLLVILVIAFISFLFPEEVKFKYHFEQGQHWQYDDLIAPLDFPVSKTKAVVESEQKAIQENFVPYYVFDPVYSDKSKLLFSESFAQNLELAKLANQFKDVQLKQTRYRRYGLGLIDRIYKRGIISRYPDHKNKTKDFIINVVDGNNSIQKTIGSITTLVEVGGWIADSLFNSKLKEAEFLIPVLDNIFKANLIYDEGLNQRLLQTALNEINPHAGFIRKGELIVARDEVVTDEVFQTLLSLREHPEHKITDRQTWFAVFLGYLILTTLIVFLFLLYLRINEKKAFNKLSNLIFLLIWPVIFSYLVYLLEPLYYLDAFVIPFCIGTIIIKHFFNARLALFSHIVIILIASILSSLGYEFTFIHLMAGIVVVLLDMDLRYWNRFFRTIISILLTYFISYFALSLAQEGNLASIESSVFGMLFMNVVLCMLAYPLIPLVEKVFGFVTSITLVELSEMNHPLLKELSIKAPGTLQHSLQVANLAEAAVASIRGNTLLVKVGALYHDIGKIKNAKYFIENQRDTNPHDLTGPEESAVIIIDHVSEGVKLAKKHKLPEVIINFIKTHHGRTRVAYFYHKYYNLYPAMEKDAKPFEYPGPRPRSKEEAVLMMADSLEAASKSLQNPTGQAIDQLVDKIVGGKIASGQFEHALLSFKELEICKKEFKKLLRSIYHVRVEYPEE